MWVARAKVATQLQVHRYNFLKCQVIFTINPFCCLHHVDNSVRKSVVLRPRVFSSVGLERYLDRVEVTGSNPVTPTKEYKKPMPWHGFCVLGLCQVHL